MQYVFQHEGRDMCCDSISFRQIRKRGAPIVPTAHCSETCPKLVLVAYLGLGLDGWLGSEMQNTGGKKIAGNRNSGPSEQWHGTVKNITLSMNAEFNKRDYRYMTFHSEPPDPSRQGLNAIDLISEHTGVENYPARVTKVLQKHASTFSTAHEILPSLFIVCTHYARWMNAGITHSDSKHTEA